MIFMIYFILFWPTYRLIFLATMIRETRNQLGVALRVYNVDNGSGGSDVGM